MADGFAPGKGACAGNASSSREAVPFGTVTDQAPLIDVGQFDRVDAARSPGAYAEWMAHQRRHGPDGAIELLGLTETSRVLDLGCGTGADLTRLDETSGHAVGVDRAFTMVDAIRQGSDSAVVNADAVALPFRNDSFDACWARAVLIHVPDPEQALGELARVTRPSGRIVLSEPDHGSHVVACDCPDVFERIKAHRRQQLRNPLIGRDLPRLASAAGFDVIDTRLTPVLFRSLSKAMSAGGPFGVAVEAAVAAGAISAAEAERYESSIAELDAQGAFFFAGLAVSLRAVAPDPSL